MADPIDTNVVVRYLTEDPADAPAVVAGVFPFFEKLERGEGVALLAPLVLFQSYFVLTSYYGVPRAVAAEKLRALLAFRGLRVPEKAVLRTCLEMLMKRSADVVDAYLAALCGRRQLKGVYSFDRDLRKLGIDILPVA